MAKFEIKDKYDLADYRALMHFLCSPEGCPWDRVQTHESIRRNVLEEAYETSHAIDSGDLDNLKEELGDLLMQVLLHADMEERAGHFDLDDVADAACKKLVFRHPYVFGPTTTDDPEAVLRLWDEQKMAEKGQKTVSDAMLPVSGEVVEFNDAVDADPSVVNKDPYGEGWMVKVRMSDPSEYDALLDAEAYTALIG